MKFKMVFKNGVTVDFEAKNLKLTQDDGHLTKMEYENYERGLGIFYTDLNDISGIFAEKDNNNE